MEIAETQESVSERQGLVERRRRDGGVQLHPERALHMCDHTCREEGFTFHQLAGIVTEAGAIRTINLGKTCYTVRRLERGEQEVAASMWRDGQAEGLFEESCGQHLAWSNLCAECGNVSPSRKLGPDQQ